MEWNEMESMHGRIHRQRKQHLSGGLKYKEICIWFDIYRYTVYITQKIIIRKTYDTHVKEKVYTQCTHTQEKRM